MFCRFSDLICSLAARETTPPGRFTTKRDQFVPEPDKVRKMRFLSFPNLMDTVNAAHRLLAVE